jgi:type II secretion system protein G
LFEQGVDFTMKSRSAFTLIELLIVVAIIAILAAIAVPNFLEAQTRAKVSRVYADFRTIGTALEAYAVDNRDYPNSHNPGTGAAAWLEPPNRRLRKLTTPLAYMTKVPGPSPFVSSQDPADFRFEFQYSNQEDLLRVFPQDGSYPNCWYRVAAGLEPQADNTNPPFSEGPKWMILDRGPDARYFFDWAGTGQTWMETTVWYDPSNGTVSEGEIGRSQMKGSFQ